MDQLWTTYIEKARLKMVFLSLWLEGLYSHFALWVKGFSSHLVVTLVDLCLALCWLSLVLTLLLLVLCAPSFLGCCTLFEGATICFRKTYPI